MTTSNTSPGDSPVPADGAVEARGDVASVESVRRRLLRAAASGVPLMLTVSGASAASQSAFANAASKLPGLGEIVDPASGACDTNGLYRRQVELVKARPEGTGGWSDAATCGDEFEETWLRIGAIGTGASGTGGTWYKFDSGIYMAQGVGPESEKCLQSVTYNVVLFDIDPNSQTVGEVGTYPIAQDGQGMYASAWSSIQPGTPVANLCGS